MIIRKLHIENFGQFHDFTLEFAPGMNRLRRENEFGKTTIFEFIRRVLWGYPGGRESKQINRYPARFNDGAYGGFLEVELADGSAATLERYGEKGKLVVRRPDGSEEDGEAFLCRLTSVSADCYRNIYAVTLDELTVLSSLDGDEIRGRLYGGAITGGGVSLPKLGDRLDSKAKELYKQRRGISRIGTARQEFRAACDKRDAAVNECSRRPALEKELEELERETARLRAEAEGGAKNVAETDLLLKAHPRYVKLAELEAALAALPPVCDVPEAAARRAEELTRLLAEAERALPPAPDASKLAVLAAEAALLERELAAAGSEPLPDEADLNTAKLLTEKCAALTPFPAAPPIGVWLLTLVAPAAAVMAGFVADLRIPAVVTAGVVALAAAAGWILYLRRRAARLRLAAETERELDEFRERLGLDCPPEKFVSVLQARLRRRELASELAAAHEARAAHDRAASVKRELEELCRRFGCAAAAEMRRAAKLSAQANDLRRRRAETAAALDALLPPEKQSALEHFDPAAAAKRRDETAAKVAELEKAMFLLHQKSGAVANELKHLPGDGEIEILNSEIEAAKGALRRLVREYLVVRVCRDLLDAAVDRYERESQPEVFKHAEKLFADFTGGRYTRLYKKLATGELTVCDGATGQEKTFTALSRGSREELMLAMRLALIECTERGAEPLPVCFDDVGVNFDPARLARAEAAVEGFAAGRQVIWFSHS